MKYLSIILFAILFSADALFGQNKNVLEDLDYNTEYTFGFNWNTNGDILGGFNFKYSKRRRANIFDAYMVELVNVKHPKEMRISHDSTVNQFVMHKQNYLFVLRPQYGKEIVLFRKDKGEGVQMNLMLAAGPSIGIVKPYFIYYGINSLNYQTVAYDPDKTSILTNTYGSAGFFDGLSQSKLRLGLNAKVSCLFEFGAFSNNLTGAEIGFLAEAFTKKIIILSQESNRNIFFSAFINVYFGARE